MLWYEQEQQRAGDSDVIGGWDSQRGGDRCLDDVPVTQTSSAPSAGLQLIHVPEREREGERKRGMEREMEGERTEGRDRWKERNK